MGLLVESEMRCFVTLRCDARSGLRDASGVDWCGTAAFPVQKQMRFGTG